MDLKCYIYENISFRKHMHALAVRLDLIYGRIEKICTKKSRNSISLKFKWTT